MSLNRQNILGIRVVTDAKEKVLEYIQKYLIFSRQSSVVSRQKRHKPFVIVTPNPEQIVYAHAHQHFADILNQADVALPDGIGITFASQFLRPLTGSGKQATVKERIPGVEFMEDLVQLAVDRGDRIGLIGGYHGLAVRALECLQVKYPKLDGWVEELGEIHIGDLGILGDLGDIKRIAEKIHSTDTHMIFVGLGAPKQEYFIARLCRELSFRPPSRNPEKKGWIPGQARDDKIVLMSVGGSFDIITGRLKRAPLFIRSIGFEWAWRLASEPWRWRRQLALLKFVWLVLLERLSRRAG